MVGEGLQAATRGPPAGTQCIDAAVGGGLPGRAVLDGHARPSGRQHGDLRGALVSARYGAQVIPDLRICTPAKQTESEIP
jgi:hypothetical protein